MESEFCQKRFLSRAALRTIADTKRQFAEQLSEIGFLPSGVNISHMERAKKVRTCSKDRRFIDVALNNDLFKGDGVLEATGAHYNTNSSNSKVTDYHGGYEQGTSLSILRSDHQSSVDSRLLSTNLASGHA